MNEEELSQAAARAAELLNEALPRPEDSTHEFSPRFRRKMRHLIFRQQHPILMRGLQSAAVLFLTVSILFGTLFATNTDANNFASGWTTIKIGPVSVYAYFGDAYTGEIPQFSLGWIPDGYTLDSIRETESGIAYTYRDADGRQAFFNFTVPTIDMHLVYPQRREYHQEAVSINGMTGTLYLSSNAADRPLITWINTERNILFNVSAYTDIETLVKMAESVQEK